MVALGALIILVNLSGAQPLQSGVLFSFIACGSSKSRMSNEHTISS